MTTTPKIKHRRTLSADSVLIRTKIEPIMLHKIDAFIQRQKDQISRTEAVRRLVDLGLKGKR